MNDQERAIYLKVDKEYKLEDITNALLDKHGYKEEEITDTLLETTLRYYQKGLDNDDSWNDILDEAIACAKKLLKEKGVN